MSAAARVAEPGRPAIGSGGGSVVLLCDRDDGSPVLAAILAAASGPVQSVHLHRPEKIRVAPTAFVVDADLRVARSIEQIRELLGEDFAVPRLFVADPHSHHDRMQALALSATATIARPFEPEAILLQLRAAFRSSFEDDLDDEPGALRDGISDAHALLVRIFEDLPSGAALSLDDVMQHESSILEATRSAGLEGWLTIVRRHHAQSYRHCLLVTGVAAAFAQNLGMRETDQRRVVRAALLHDVGKAFIPLSLLDKPGRLEADEMRRTREHARLGFDMLVRKGGMPIETLDVVLHHHEMLDGSGYPDGLMGGQISDLVRILTIVDIFSALIEVRAYKGAMRRTDALAIMQAMGGKLDRALLRAFQPVALGSG